MAHGQIRGTGAGYTYEEWAQIYLRQLTLDNHMEATPQATQREITLESLALVRARREDFHLFNELLVQYPRDDRERPGQVVPDNMVVIHPGPIHAVGSYDLPTQPARPFWVLEYVSKGSVRKDYEGNFEKYEKGLQVPYYLIFYPDIQDLSLFRLTEGRYAAVPPNGQGRCGVPELEIEVGLLGGWVRFWHQGQLLPLPAELQRDLETARRELTESRRELTESRQQLDQARERETGLERRLAKEQEDREALLRELERLRAGLGQGRTEGA